MVRTVRRRGSHRDRAGDAGSPCDGCYAQSMTSLAGTLHIRVSWAALAAAMTLAGCGGLPLPSPTASGLPSSTPVPAPAEPSSAAASGTPSTSPTAAPSAAGDDVLQLMAGAIAGQRPNVQFQLQPDQFDGNWVLDGNGRDLFGEGRLFISYTPAPGAFAAHPCADRTSTRERPALNDSSTMATCWCSGTWSTSRASRPSRAS